MILCAIYDPVTFQVIGVPQYYDEIPVNGTDILMTEQFVNPYFNPATQEYYEGATAPEIRLSQIAWTKQKYEMHRVNGWEAYQDFRANIVELIAEEELTEEQAFMIEFDLGPAYDKIADKGDWKTALYVLSNMTVSFPFIQPFLDSAIDIVTNYIATNYDS